MTVPWFVCLECGGRVCYSAGDEGLQKARGWRCALCYTVIHSRRFPAPAASGAVLFGPAGPGLGDEVFLRFVADQYGAANPGQRVELWCNGARNTTEATVFWPDNAPATVPAPAGALRFPLANEAAAFARDGGRPRLWFDPEPVDLVGEAELGRIVVVSLRNIERCPEKNATAAEAEWLCALLAKLHRSGAIGGAVLVGNDRPADDWRLPAFAIDARGQLSLGQIARLCGGALCTVGKDSGLLHLAGAAGGYVIGWGYRERNWMPLSAPGRGAGIMAGGDVCGAVAGALQDRALA